MIHQGRCRGVRGGFSSDPASRSLVAVQPQEGPLSNPSPSEQHPCLPAAHAAATLLRTPSTRPPSNAARRGRGHHHVAGVHVCAVPCAHGRAAGFAGAAHERRRWPPACRPARRLACSERRCGARSCGQGCCRGGGGQGGRCGGGQGRRGSGQVQDQGTPEAVSRRAGGRAAKLGNLPTSGVRVVLRWGG